MGFFDGGETAARLAQAEAELQKLRQALKDERATVAKYKQAYAHQKNEIERLQAELAAAVESAKRAVRKARDQAKNSKERAARFKAKLDQLTVSVTE